MKRILTMSALALACGAATAQTPTTEELLFAKAECKAPTIPSHSVSPDGARRVERSVKNWRNCFNGWRDKVLTVYPQAKGMPAELSANVIDAIAQDDKIIETLDAWTKASREYNKGLGLPRDIRERMESDQAEHLAVRVALVPQQ